MGILPGVIRYDYRCENCGTVVELVMSIASDPAKRPGCRKCGAKNALVRQMGFGNTTHAGINAAAHTYKQYPVISNRLPFELPDCPHAGRLKKSVITSRAHERKVYDRLGLVRGG